MSIDEKLKHLEFIQAAIARMATNSFLFKGWSVTIAAGLAAFAAVDSRAALLVIALASTVMFWGLDGYYLWLEKEFIELHVLVAGKKESDVIDFAMRPGRGSNRRAAFRKWFKTCWRPHLWVFYGAIILIDVVGICLIRSN